MIVDPTYLVPEPKLALSDVVFNGWFGIPFQDNLSFTHINISHFSEILTLYGVTYLILFI